MCGYLSIPRLDFLIVQELGIVTVRSSNLGIPHYSATDRWLKVSPATYEDTVFKCPEALSLRIAARRVALLLVLLPQPKSSPDAEEFYSNDEKEMD